MFVAQIDYLDLTLTSFKNIQTWVFIGCDSLEYFLVH